MTSEEDFRRLLDKFGQRRVRADVEAALYAPVRLAWARTWLADQEAGIVAAPSPQANGTPPLAEADAAELRHGTADALDLAAEATRTAREARAIARQAKAAARRAWFATGVAVIAAIAAAVVVALSELRLV